MQQLNTLNLEREGYLVGYTTEHPSIRQIDARVHQLTGTIERDIIIGPVRM